MDLNSGQQIVLVLQQKFQEDSIPKSNPAHQYSVPVLFPEILGHETKCHPDKKLNQADCVSYSYQSGHAAVPPEPAEPCEL